MRAAKNLALGSILTASLSVSAAVSGQDAGPEPAAAPTGFVQPAECADAAACAQLGWDRYWAMDYAGAIAAMEWACGQGNYRGCDGLTGTYVMVCDSPTVIPESFARAEAECSAGNVHGCRTKGLLMVQGCGGIEFQFDAAIALLQSACAGGQAVACVDHAQLTNGWDNVAMRAAFITACTAGVPSACANLASRYEFGLNDDGIDLGRALYFHARGCELGDNFECIGAENLRTTNPGLEPVGP